MQLLVLTLKQTEFIRRKAWACFALLLVFSQAVVLLAGDTGEISRISAYQVKELLGRPDTVVVDVRTYRNWWRSSKKIPTAIREDPSKVDQSIEKYVKDQTLIFYCS
jgi:hypothetical protein